MHILLFQTAKGLFPSSGGYRANNSLLRYLSSKGHRVRQICYSTQEEVQAYVRRAAKSGSHDSRRRERLLYLRSGDNKPGVHVSVYDLVMDYGVEVVALDSTLFDADFGGKAGGDKRRAKQTALYIDTKTTSPTLEDFVSFLQAEILRFSATHLIFNDGLSMQVSFTGPLAQADVYRVAVVHTAEQLPFGPFAGGLPGHSTSPTELDRLMKLDGIWSVSEAIKAYALEHGQLQSCFLEHHPWTYRGETDHEMPPHLHNWDKRFVGMINPCKVKGSDLFEAMAEACPEFQFLAYSSWGHDNGVIQRMKALPNMTIGPPCTDEDRLWREIKVIVVPSVWLEAWGMVAVEAHLRGIQLLCSNAGALPEAILGLDYIIPVNPIEGHYDETGAYVVPQQDAAPWVGILRELMGNRTLYESVSLKARDTTTKWLQNLDEAALETWLAKLGGSHQHAKI
ncbi:hypothetical protein Micbo1qcDRAFT_126946 [Microdochium bolleyi]|uniref:Glycosyl transferase family 1 domain-containing protein n=1 Tax=Microdochium bolleyi TaxID=196109 RepID=A0A136IM76_9PEZI|nr:hypothetical protein Micbo1qcDRAFT_126946 [Microdochium bolleyi]